MIKDLVSIIIPCYNSAEFISETLDSILIQKDSNFEIIIVNDGSTDTSAQIILAYTDPRITYFYQPNSGVSSARNFGFSQSKGQYIIFFDADDLMTADYISSRLQGLKNSNFDFICGRVIKFQSQQNNRELIKTNEYYRGTSSSIVPEILLYNPIVTTCPSNYMFKTSFLTRNDLCFNVALASTADKYFLLRCAVKGKTEFINTCSPLLYRVHGHSMSHLISKTLVADNEMYHALVINNNLIPAEIKNKS
ncbi:MAG: family 2 glycosyl transferase, partial [Bacteroidetes bacterium]|nr:family 2 glycosyl transferase [Bacteroidota bacterium]